MVLGFSKELYGKKTFFVEMIMAGFTEKELTAHYDKLGIDFTKNQVISLFDEHNYDFDYEAYELFVALGIVKYHTIRKSHRWYESCKAHMFINVRTKDMIQIVPEVRVDIQEILIRKGEVYIDDERIDDISDLCRNDGISKDMFRQFFGDEFDGQIVGWHGIKYTDDGYE